MSGEPDEIIPPVVVTLTVYPEDHDAALRTVEALSRASAGLGLDGIGSTLQVIPLDEDGCAHEIDDRRD